MTARTRPGAVVDALADTGMGAALYPTLDPGEICATIELFDLQAERERGLIPGPSDRATLDPGPWLIASTQGSF